MVGIYPSGVMVSSALYIVLSLLSQHSAVIICYQGVCKRKRVGNDPLSVVMCLMMS